MPAHQPPPRMRVGATASFVALAGVIVPMLAGFGLMTAFGYNTRESLFVGAAMVATRSEATARAIRIMNILPFQSVA